LYRFRGLYLKHFGMPSDDGAPGGSTPASGGEQNHMNRLWLREKEFTARLLAGRGNLDA
jgi:hypothetical protein